MERAQITGVVPEALRARAIDAARRTGSTVQDVTAAAVVDVLRTLRATGDVAVPDAPRATGVAFTVRIPVDVRAGLDAAAQLTSHSRRLLLCAALATLPEAEDPTDREDLQAALDRALDGDGGEQAGAARKATYSAGERRPKKRPAKKRSTAKRSPAKKSAAKKAATKKAATKKAAPPPAKKASRLGALADLGTDPLDTRRGSDDEATS